MKRRPNSNCKICGEALYRRPSQIEGGSVYCSLICAGRGQRVFKKCSICSREYSGRKRTCSRECANKKRIGIVYSGRNENNKARQVSILKVQLASLRGGVCEICRNKNYRILQVHHKIPRAAGGSNRLRNLRLLCPNCYAEHHQGFGLFSLHKSAKNGYSLTRG